MPIRDNRTLLDAADTLTNFVEEDGSTMGLSLNTARVQGTNAVVKQVSAAREGIFYDAGANQDWSDNVFYIWWNLTTSNLLDTFENLGVTIRFAAGATPSTNFFEVSVAGSNTYSGGWQMAVIDIEEARALALSSPTNNNAAVGGTAPATSAIQYVGVMYDVTGMIPGTDPNAFLDAIWRLPVGTPGIIVSGSKGGSPINRPWAWDDIVDAGDVGDSTKAWGTISKADGVIKVNTPIQFGASGSPNEEHNFEDTLAVVAWESQLVRDGFYGMTFLGDGTNPQRWQMGVSGSAGQGLTMLAATDGPRWFIDASDANLDEVNFFGCSLSHTTSIDIDNPNVSMFDTLLLDGQRLWHSRADSPYMQSPQNGADFQRNSIIAATPSTYDRGEFESPPGDPVLSPESDVSYIHTSDPDRITDCTFIYSDGHAIQINEPGTYDFIGNEFTGYSESPEGEAEIHYALEPLAFQERVLVENAVTFMNTSSRRRLGTTVDYAGEQIKQVRLALSYISGRSVPTSPMNLYLELFQVTDYTSFPGYPGPSDDDVPLATSLPVDGTDLLESISTGDGNFTDKYFEFDPPFQITPYSPLEIFWALRFENIDRSPTTILRVRSRSQALVSPITSYEARTEFRFSAGSPEIWQWASENFVMDYSFYDWDLILNVSDAATPRVHAPPDTAIQINNNVQVTLTNIRPGTEVRVYPAQDFNSPQDLTEIAGIEETGSPTEFTFSASAGQLVDIVVLNQDYVLPPANRIRNFEVPATSTSFPISQIIDRNFSNP